ncbi:MAG: carbohydrate ABC transporter permease [Alphaproteobacteria bacterium]
MKKKLSSRILMNIFIGFVILFWVTPFSWILTTAFNPYASSALQLPRYITFEHFQKALQDERVLLWVFNSLWVAVAVATLTSIIVIMAAFPFSRLEFKGKGAILWFIILVRIIPFTATILPIYLFSSKIGLLNLGGVVLYQSVFAIPFGVLLMKSFYDVIPFEFDESAALEGASIMQIIFYIIAPLSRSGIIVIWFMTFLQSWNDFLFPFIFARTEAQHTMAIGLYSAFKENSAIDYGLLAVLSIIYCIPSVGLYFFARKKMKTGFAGVGVKG